MKIYIVDGSAQYYRMFERMGHTIISHIPSADLVCFTGGEDVSPSFYGDAPHKYTGSNYHRDTVEEKLFDEALDHNIPMVGICRGGQFLNVMSGGRMYQHVEEHCRSHLITDVESGDTLWVSSTHHQMMMPSSKAVLVASSTLGGSREWFDGDIAKKDVSKQDIEVVYYQHTNCLCFQPHPEFEGEGFNPMLQYFKKLLDQYLGVK